MDILPLVTDNNNIGGTTAFYASLADANAQTNSLSTTTLSPTIDTKYYVREDTTGCFDIDSIMITVNNITAPVISADAAYCLGNDPIALSAATAAVGDGTLTYQWQSNTTGCTATFTDIMTGGMAATYDPPVITTTTYYRVITTSTLGTAVCSDTSNCITLTIHPNPILATLTSEGICFGDSFTSSNVTTNVTNGVNVSYQWYNDNGANNTGTAAISGQITASLTDLPTAAGSYSYRVEATSTDNSACLASQTVNLVIHELPSVMVEDVIKCTSNPEIISASPSGGTAPYTYIWSGPVDLSAETGDNFTTAVSGIYTVTVTDSEGCTDTNSGELTQQSTICLPVNFSIKRGN